MTDENIAWLRYHICLDDPHVYNRIADALQAKNARIAELEAVMKPFADKAKIFHDYVDDYPVMFGAEPPLRVGDFRAARAALNGEKV